MKVKEMIEWLQQQDQDAQVQVASDAGAFGMIFVRFNPDRHATLFDLNNYPNSKGKPYQDCKFLRIGA